AIRNRAVGAGEDDHGDTVGPPEINRPAIEVEQMNRRGTRPVGFIPRTAECSTQDRGRNRGLNGRSNNRAHGGSAFHSSVAEVARLPIVTLARNSGEFRYQ